MGDYTSLAIGTVSGMIVFFATLGYMSRKARNAARQRDRQKDFDFGESSGSQRI